MTTCQINNLPTKQMTEFTRSSADGKKKYTFEDFVQLWNDSMETEFERCAFLEDMEDHVYSIFRAFHAVDKDERDIHLYIHAQQNANTYPVGNFLKMQKSEMERCDESAIRHACQFLEAGCPGPSFDIENHYGACRFNVMMFDFLKNKSE